MVEDSFSFFLKRALVLGLPLALQSLLFSSGGFIDNLMVSQLGTQEVAASSIGARVFWFVGIFIWGMGTGMGVLLAQFWGAQDEEGLRRNFALGSTFSCGASLLLFLVCWFFPSLVPAMFNAQGETARLAEATYKLSVLPYCWPGQPFRWMRRCGLWENQNNPELVHS